MGVDRTGAGTDNPAEATEEPPPPERRPPPDRPGAEGAPSRADSRNGAVAANDTSVQNSDKQGEKKPEPAQELGVSDHADRQEQAPDGQAASRNSADSAETDEEEGPSEGSDSAAVAAIRTGEEPAFADASAHQKTAGGTDSSNETGAGVEAADPKTDDASDDGDSHIGTAESSAGRIAPLDSSSGGQIDGERRAIPGDGLPDDNARVGHRDDSAVERGIFTSLKQAVMPDRGDRPTELVGMVNRPDFQDPQENPRLVPDRYGAPLERADGTRTPLFDGAPTREQTKQGALGDCGIIATLGAVAGHRPEVIRDCVRETDDGNYAVRLHEAKYSTSRMRYEPTGRPITLTVTSDLPVYADDPGKPAFADSTSTGAAWAPVLEKAIAGTDQTWNDERRQKWTERWDVQGNGDDAPKGYIRLNQGSNPSDRAELLTQLTGQPAKSWELPTGYDHNGRSADRQLVDEFRKQLADNKPILVGTRSLRKNEPPLAKDLQECHAYEVTKVDDRGLLHLRNPWNDLHPEPLTIKEFRADIRPRYTTLE